MNNSRKVLDLTITDEWGTREKCQCQGLVLAQMQ